MKKRKSCFIWLLCILLLVTALPAVDFTDVQAASISSTFTGWKTSAGKKYYYKNGKNADRPAQNSASIITVLPQTVLCLQGGTVFIIVSDILANRLEECVSIRL